MVAATATVATGAHHSDDVTTVATRKKVSFAQNVEIFPSNTPTYKGKPSNGQNIARRSNDKLVSSFREQLKNVDAQNIHLGDRVKILCSLAKGMTWLPPSRDASRLKHALMARASALYNDLKIRHEHLSHAMGATRRKAESLEHAVTRRRNFVTQLSAVLRMPAIEKTMTALKASIHRNGVERKKYEDKVQTLIGQQTQKRALLQKPYRLAARHMMALVGNNLLPGAEIVDRGSVSSVKNDIEQLDKQIDDAGARYEPVVTRLRKDNEQLKAMGQESRRDRRLDQGAAH